MADKAVDQGGAPGMQTSKRVTWITRFVFVFVASFLVPNAIVDWSARVDAWCDRRWGARLASGGQRLLASASESDQSAFDREFSDH